MHQVTSTDTSRLPLQLLVKVLQHAGPQQAAQSCARVCHAWREAAALSVKIINIKHCNQAKATSLAHWLQANKVAVQDITVEGYSLLPQLQLPPTKLYRVSSVRLQYLRVISALAEQDTIGLVPWDVSELTALTCLELHKCEVQLQGLPALKGLQALAVTSVSGGSITATRANSRVLAASVALLQHLTSLHLGGVLCNNAVLAHISRLTRLQDLELSESACTAESFQQLPQSLTRLVVSASGHIWSPPDSLTVSATSTPGVCQLRALQDLTVSWTREFDIGVVSALTALTRLVLDATSMVAAPDGPRLAVLTALTNLQHLVLPSQCSDRPAAVTAEDFGAITASQQLTFLDLSCGPINDVGQLQTAFPAGAAQPRLPCLQELKLDERWLLDSAHMDRVVSCCPNLKSIHVVCNGGEEVEQLQAWVWVRGLRTLTRLSRLTCLMMETSDMQIGPAVRNVIASLTGLRRLQLGPLDPSGLASILRLQACRQLEELQIGVLRLDWPDFNLLIKNKAPQGSPPDVWCQLPQALLQAAVDNPDLISLDPAAVHALLEAAAAACGQLLAAHSELQQQVTGLQAEVRQQVAALRADMAAMFEASAAARSRS